LSRRGSNDILILAMAESERSNAGIGGDNSRWSGQLAREHDRLKLLLVEEKHAEGHPLQEALLDAGIMRLRPVSITVGATVIALFPLASHGGPLWEPLCYAQIGGLVVATFITLLLVPVIYAIFVLDLKLVKWEQTESESTGRKALAAGH
jgi:hypothetical protein